MLTESEKEYFNQDKTCAVLTGRQKEIRGGHAHSVVGSTAFCRKVDINLVHQLKTSEGCLLMSLNYKPWKKLDLRQ